MKPPAPDIQYIELDVNALGQQGLDDLVAAILESAQTSALVLGNTVLQASVAAIATASTSAKSLGAQVVVDETKLATDKALFVEAMSALVVGVLQYKGLVETTAKTAAAVKSTAFKPLLRATPGPLVVPPGIDTYIAKKGHKAKVSAQQTGTTRRYAAQVCLDPLASNVWTDLEGYGKSHWLSGYKSGTVVWVRFATVRGHQKSDWCTPVAITIP